MLRVRPIIRIIYVRTRNSIRRSNTILQVNDRRPLLNIVIGARAAKRNVSSLLHGGLGHRTVVDVAVSVEGRLNLPVRGLVRIVVLRSVLRKASHEFLRFLGLLELSRQLTNALEVGVGHRVIGSMHRLEGAVVVLQVSTYVLLPVRQH